MSMPQRMRLGIQLFGFAVALLFIFLEPLDGGTNIWAAGATLLIASIISQFVFRLRASHGDKLKDLRDRVDNRF